jgi:hypothetical protein
MSGRGSESSPTMSHFGKADTEERAQVRCGTPLRANSKKRERLPAT